MATPIPILTQDQREAFNAKIIPAGEEGCWLWCGYVNDRGYPRCSIGGKLFAPARVAYALSHGDPRDKYVLRTCTTPNCVSPYHLITSEYCSLVRDQRVAASGVCRNGHPRTPENTTRYSGRVVCRVCTRARNREFHRRRKGK